MLLFFFLLHLWHNMSVFYQRNKKNKRKKGKWSSSTMREMKHRFRKAGELAKGYCHICSPAFPCRGYIDLNSLGSTNLSAYQILPKVDSGHYLFSLMLGFLLSGALCHFKPVVSWKQMKMTTECAYAKSTRWAMKTATVLKWLLLRVVVAVFNPFCQTHRLHYSSATAVTVLVID